MKNKSVGLYGKSGGSCRSGAHYLFIRVPNLAGISLASGGFQRSAYSVRRICAGPAVRDFD